MHPSRAFSHASVFRGILLALVCVSGMLGPNAWAWHPVPSINQPLVPGTAAPGGPGFTLTVNGSGFVSGSIVNWNGSPLVTTFVNKGQLRAKVPATNIAAAGTAAVTVVSPALGGGSSNVVHFSITKATNFFSFRRADYESGVTPSDVILADLNGDGKLDVVVANHTFGDTVSVFLGNGDGTLRSREAFVTGGWPASPIAADFNGDGKPDLVVANYLDDNVGIFLGNGNGTFQNQKTFASGRTPSQLIAGDFNGDGRLDLAIANCRCFNPGPSTVSVLLGNGDGTFRKQVEYAAGTSAIAIVTGDFNRDGKLDLAVANYYSNNVSVLLGKGDGTFQEQVQYPVGEHPYRMEVADLNGDGILDLVTNNNQTSSVSVLLGKGDGTFKPQTEYAVGGSPIGGTVGDLNGDGIPDLLISSMQANSVSVLFGKGDGTFQHYVSYAHASPTNSVAMGDLNGDGRLDLVTPNGESEDNSRVSVFLQDTTAPVTVATVSGPIGEDGWFRGPVVVTLRASDPDDKVAVTYYSVDGGAKETYKAPFSITTNGIHSLLFYSVDTAGNRERSRSRTIKIDVTPPQISPSAHLARLWPPNGNWVRVLIQGTISDSASGDDADGARFKVNDEYGQIEPGGLIKLYPNGSYSFAVWLRASVHSNDTNGRVYTITVSAKDNAGNHAAASANVVVPHS